jgi:hypothetical protein
MKESLFILAVIALLFLFTALKYRRELRSIIEFYKEIKRVRSNIRSQQRPARDLHNNDGIQLIKCERCGKWVPYASVEQGPSRPVCADGCDLAVPK